MSLSEIMQELEGLGSPSIKKVLLKHGALEPFFGVKVEHLKVIQKRIKTDHPLAMELYATGNSDAMYLAGLIAEDSAMTEADLQRWVEQARWSLISESTVPWVAAGSQIGRVMALRWIESDVETIPCAGWCTLSSILSIAPDASLDLAELTCLLDRVANNIHSRPNRVRYCMNGFVIAAGTFTPALTQHALTCADKIGPVSVNVGDTACKVPGAREYISAAIARGTVGKKRKSAKC